MTSQMTSRYLKRSPASNADRFCRVRGPWARSVRRAADLEKQVCGTRLDADVRKAFRSERAVNDALRLVIELRKVGSYKRRASPCQKLCDCFHESKNRRLQAIAHNKQEPQTSK
jgi:uncharacterized protein (DUF4415 family)